MKRVIMVSLAAMLLASGAAVAGFEKGNGETQFGGNNLPNSEKEHPSLSERNDNGKTKKDGEPNGGNAWATHTKGTRPPK
jgi:hypothetical protein